LKVVCVELYRFVKHRDNFTFYLYQRTCPSPRHFGTRHSKHPNTLRAKGVEKEEEEEEEDRPFYET